MCHQTVERLSLWVSDDRTLWRHSSQLSRSAHLLLRNPFKAAHFTAVWLTATSLCDCCKFKRSKEDVMRKCFKNLLRKGDFNKPKYVPFNIWKAFTYRVIPLYIYLRKTKAKLQGDKRRGRRSHCFIRLNEALKIETPHQSSIPCSTPLRAQQQTQLCSSEIAPPCEIGATEETRQKGQNEWFHFGDK